MRAKLVLMTMVLALIVVGCSQPAEDPHEADATETEEQTGGEVMGGEEMGGEEGGEEMGGGEGGEELAVTGCCDYGDNNCGNTTEDTCISGTFHAGGTCRALPDGGGTCGVLQE